MSIHAALREATGRASLQTRQRASLILNRLLPLQGDAGILVGAQEVEAPQRLCARTEGGRAALMLLAAGPRSSQASLLFR